MKTPLSALLTSSTWFLSETRARATAVRNELREGATILPSGDLRRAEGDVWCGTVGEGVYRIARTLTARTTLPGCEAGEVRPTLRRLSELQALTALRGVILRESERFPRLRASIGEAASLAESSLSSIKRLIDTVRLFQSTERLIASTIDEFGNTLTSKLRAEEILLLLDQYHRLQRERVAFDSVGLLEIVTEALSHSRLLEPLRREILPERIIFDRPTFLFPLGSEFWRRLHTLTNVTVVLDEGIEEVRHEAPHYRPSVRHAATVGRFLRERKVEPIIAPTIGAAERERVVRRVLDGERVDGERVDCEEGDCKEGSGEARGLSSPRDLGVEVWRCEDRRDEVQKTVRAINHLLSQGVVPSSITVVPLESEPYGALLRRELQQSGVPFSLARGLPLAGSPAASLFSAVFEWLERPSVTNANLLWGGEFAAPCLIARESLEEGHHRYGDAVLRVSLGELLAEEELFQPRALLEVCARAVVSPRLLLEGSEREKLVESLSLFLSRSLLRGSLKSKECLTAWRTLLFYDHLARGAQAESFSTPAEAIQRAILLFHTVRHRVSHHSTLKLGSRSGASSLHRNLRLPSEREYLGDFLRTTRSVRRLARELRELNLELLQEGRGEGGESLRAAKLFTRESIALSTFALPAAEDGIQIVDLSETKALEGGFVFLLGALPDAFPAQQKSFGDDSYTVASAIARKLGSSDAVFESYLLLAHHLRNAQRVVLSVPAEAGGARAGESVIVDELSKMVGQGVLQSAAGEGSQSFREGRENNLDEPFLRRKRAVSERQKSVLTPYDGAIGREGAEKLAAWRGANRGGFLYSASALETLADCPHRFFFQRALLLRPREVRPLEQIALYTGGIVHEALRLFFQDKTLTASSFTLDKFRATCERMFEIATRLFAESEVEWEADLRLRVAKQGVLSGLRGEGRKGPLKAALDIQRLLLPSLPVEVEYRFGDKERPPVVVRFHSEESRQVRLTGIIDRIDLVQVGGESRFVVWDYKTGEPDSSLRVREGKSLQIPIYALAVQQLLPPFQPPVRGGLIALKNAQCDDEELIAAASRSKATAAPLVEHLVFARSVDYSEEEVLHRIEEVKSTIEHLDSAVREGRLHQKLDTKLCYRCEFQTICCRDESLLEEKLRGEERAGLSYTAPHSEPSLERRASEEPRTSHEQEEACTFERDVALFAGAGSGKTFVLRTRVLRLILRGEPLSSLLAITFTEKAAGEIRERIERAITDALQENRFEGRALTEEERRRLVEARALLPNGVFGTIHSFAMSIISMDAELAGGISPRILHSTEPLDMALSELFDEAVEKPEKVREALHQVIRGGVSPYALEQVLRSLGRRREVLERGVMFRERYGTPEEQERFLEEIRSALLAETAHRFEAPLEELLLGMEEWFQGDRGGVTLTAEIESDFQSAILHGKKLLQKLGAREEWVPEAAALLRFLEDRRSSQRSKSKKNPINYWKEVRETLEALPLPLLLAPKEREAQGLQLGYALVVIAEHVHRRFTEEKRALRRVDYDDLIFIAHQMVSESESLRLRLRQQFRHIMVDEFQDTDEFQWAIIRAIAERTPGESALRTLFIVGDPQQAIYGFRGGDVRVFNRCVREIEARGGALLTLQNNFRSHPEVVEFINTSFSTLFGLDFDGSGAPRVDTAVRFQTMVSGRSGEASSERVEFRSLEGEGERVREAEQIATFISEVLGEVHRSDGAYPALREYRDRGGPLVAVLTRSIKDLLRTAHALHLAGVPFSITHSSGFYELQEILNLENLLKVFADPEDSIALVGVLRSPLFGFSDAEIATLCVELKGRWGAVWGEAGSEILSDIGRAEGGETQSQILSDQSALFRAASTTLLRWRTVKRFLSAGEFLAYVVEECRLGEVYTDLGDDGEYRNVLRFIDELRMAESSGEVSGSMLAALQWLDLKRRSAASAPDANQRTNPVVLTTVHGSKGLEFPMVILPFLNWSASRQHDFLVGERPEGAIIGVKVEDENFSRQKTALSWWLEKEKKLRETAEERRVFYVGCTRAREHLVFFSSASSEEGGELDFKAREKLRDSPQPNSWLRLLREERAE